MPQDITITGWQTGLQTISLMKVIMRVSGVPMRDAKRDVERLLGGEAITVPLVSGDAAEDVLAEITALGAVCASNGAPRP